MFRNMIYKLIDAQTATGAGQTQTVDSPKRNYQLIVTGTGAISAAVTVYGSLDGVRYEIMATLTATGTTTASDQIETTRQWRYTYANVTAISGTGATANLYMEVI